MGPNGSATYRQDTLPRQFSTLRDNSGFHLATSYQDRYEQGDVWARVAENRTLHRNHRTTACKLWSRGSVG